MTPVRWGFLGAGFVAGMAMGPAVHASHNAQLQVVGARDKDRALSLGPTRVVSTYEEVITDSDVDAVYISLTNEVHEQWVESALNADKFVLCEKPLAISHTSARRMTSAAKPGQLVEALWYRWHPRFQRTLDIVAAGAIGEITGIESTFCFDGVPEDNYRLQASRGGGATLDVGPYTLDSAMKLIGAATGQPVNDVEIVRRRTLMSHGKDGVDLTTQAELLMNDVPVTWRVSINSPAEQTFRVTGTLATLSWTGAEAFTVWKSPCELTVTDTNKGSTTTEAFDSCDPYQLMIEQCGEVMREGSAALMTNEDSLRLAAIIDQVCED
ncbi:MAG: Gfo/Idh/MocA family oxidoreductase [Actinobacteria bacterium]|nr:Gfo/Idh/MocA family oxidoreductase [Actinomycetota bacterium]